ncbi:MAG: hypothetical protein ACFFBV_12370 [Promethearchaeota archaeon]
MEVEVLEKNEILTPSFVYDEGGILESFQLLGKVINKQLCKTLFPLKSFALIDALRFMVPVVDGFAGSSLFEAKLAREIAGNNRCVHLTTPGIRPDEVDDVSELCDYISFNSLRQWQEYHVKVRGKASCGIRVNPQLPFVKDERYNPCRKNSKLGIPLDLLRQIISTRSEELKGVKGLHFHTNSESTALDQLFITVSHIDASLPRLLDKIAWVNIGGGYLFDEMQSLDKLIDVVSLLNDNYDVEIFIEPGKAIVGKAGYLISSIIDLFESEGSTIAVLDTTVNHMPEVFEYQFKPDIAQESEDGKYQYILAGSTCLAGDVFGEYRFDEPLEIGSRIVFEDMGAYTLVKANMFNGINLPTIYAYTLEGKLELKKQFGYEDFLSRCGVNNNDTI